LGRLGLDVSHARPSSYPTLSGIHSRRLLTSSARRFDRVLALLQEKLRMHHTESKWRHFIRWKRRVQYALVSSAHY